MGVPRPMGTQKPARAGRERSWCNRLISTITNSVVIGYGAWRMRATIAKESESIDTGRSSFPKRHLCARPRSVVRLASASVAAKSRVNAGGIRPKGEVRVLSVIAFHEKAGRSQVDSFCFSLDKFFLSGRVATVAMLPSALSRSDSFARCTLGVLVSAGAAI
jgi:hypothetical protein